MLTSDNKIISNLFWVKFIFKLVLWEKQNNFNKNFFIIVQAFIILNILFIFSLIYQIFYQIINVNKLYIIVF